MNKGKIELAISQYIEWLNSEEEVISKNIEQPMRKSLYIAISLLNALPQEKECVDYLDKGLVMFLAHLFNIITNNEVELDVLLTGLSNQVKDVIKNKAFPLYDLMYFMNKKNHK